jgi:hypothetical protein
MKDPKNKKSGKLGKKGALKLALALITGKKAKDLKPEVRAMRKILKKASKKGITPPAVVEIWAKETKSLPMTIASAPSAD